MNTKTVGLASGKHSHHYLLLLLGIDAKGLLLCGRTMQVIDDEPDEKEREHPRETLAIRPSLRRVISLARGRPSGRASDPNLRPTRRPRTRRGEREELIEA